MSSTFNNCTENSSKSLTGSVLYSLAGCKRQERHSDNPSRTDEEFNNAINSYICLFAVEEDTRLYVYGKDGIDVTVDIPPGALFVGGGLLIHAGHDYEMDNLRFHFYVDVKGNKRDHNDSTYFYDFYAEERCNDARRKNLIEYRDSFSKQKRKQQEKMALVRNAKFSKY